MRPVALLNAAAAALSFAVVADAQQNNNTCSNILTPSYTSPVVASGWVAQLIAKDLKSPRSIQWDSNGHLLVVQQGVGIQRLTFKDNGRTCLEVTESKSVVDDTGLNHGIAFSKDGKTLFASTSDNVYAWTYDPSSGTISGDRKTVVGNMGGTGHVTRTLLMTSTNMLVVSKGSGENIDDRARDMNSGVSQIRAFDMETLPDTVLDFATAGTMLGWGLRNSVGVAEEPKTGGIFSVENSVDQITRNGTDIHQDNPGEELNFHGFLNGTTDNQGGNYGYPVCFALWDANIPDLNGLEVGNQFPMAPNDTFTDATCNKDIVAPRLTFQAHMAPLDIKFLPNGTEAYISFHGSWDRTNPIGYMLATVAFADGQPTELSTSTTAARALLSNADTKECPDGCFRPVGVALDAKERVFVSSDTTGEIYVLMSAGANTSSTGTIVGGGSSTSTNKSAAARAYVSGGGGWGAVVTVLACLLTGMGVLFV